MTVILYGKGTDMKIFEGYQKGVNLGGWISQCVSREQVHFDTFITEEDIKQIAGWGMDHVRLPLDYDIVETDDGQEITSGYRYIDDCITWCRKYDLRLILDLHRTCGYMFDAGVEGNADAFFTTATLQDRFIALWVKLAKRYASNSDMMTFEILNEIVNPDFAVIWNGIAKRAIQAIREYAPDTYIIIGGTRYNNVISVPELDAPYDDKIIYNFHCYEPLVFTHQKAYWVAGMPEDLDLAYPGTLEDYRVKSDLLPQAHAGAIYEESVTELGPKFFDDLFQPAIKKAKEENVPLYCGEYGVIDQANPEDALRWIADINGVFNKYGIGRAIWNYKNKDFGLVDEHYDGYRDELVNILTK